MRVVATPGTAAVVAERGGQLWVSTRAARCCGAPVWLETATEQPAGRAFRQVASEPFDVHLATAFAPPDELHVALGRRGRVEAFWNGCAWVT